MSVKFSTSTEITALDKASKPFMAMYKNANKLKREFRYLQKAADGVTNAGKSLSTKVTLPAAAGFLGVVKSASKFEDAMAGVAKQLPDDAGVNGLEKITKQIREMSLVANQTPAEIASIAEEAGKAAIPFKDWAEFIDLTRIAATAFDLEVGETSGKLLGIGAGLGIRDDLGKLRQLAADVNMVADSLNATPDALLDYFSRTAGVGKLANSSTDALLAIGGAFIDLNTPSETAARATSKLFTVLSTTVGITKKAKSAMRQIGLPKDFVRQFRDDAPKALTLFANRLKLVEAEKQVGLLKQIFGEDQAKHLAKLLGHLQQTGRMMDILQNKERSATKLTEEYQRQLATFTSQWQILKNHVTDFSIQLGVTLLPILKDIFTQMKPALKGMVGWMKENKKLIPTILAVVAAGAMLGPLLVGIGGGLTAVIALVKGFMLVSAMAGGAFPAFIIISAIVSLGIAIYQLIKNWNKVKEAFMDYTPIKVMIKNFKRIPKFFKKMTLGITRLFVNSVLAILNKIKSISSALKFVIPDAALTKLDSVVNRLQTASKGLDLSIADLNKPDIVMGSGDGSMLQSKVELVGQSQKGKIDTNIHVKVEGAGVRQVGIDTQTKGKSLVGNVGVSMVPA